jgi:hypothetical protein
MYPDKHVKNTVIVVQGHKYPFFSNGIYLCAELMDYYNIVLVVPQSYSLDERFLKICELMSFQKVVYFLSPSYLPRDQKDSFYGINFVKQFFHQKSYSEISKGLMLKYRPIAVLQHDYIHIENMYFFYWANRLLKNSKKIVVLSTAPSNERTLDGFSEARHKRALKLVRGNRAFAYFLFWLGTSFKLLQSSVRNILIPLAVLKEKSNYGLSCFDNIDIKPKKLAFDYFLVFEDPEQKFYGNLFGCGEIVKKISSPISRGASINEKMFTIKSVKDILILFGMTGIRTGYDTELLNRWCELIFMLSEKYIGTKIIIKVHPNLSHKLSGQFMTYFNSKCHYAHFVGSQENDIATEELILNSWLIIGDSSSALPWASYVGDKVVLSMDIGNTVNSRDMECYSEITLFSRDDDFHKIIENINPSAILGRQELHLPSVRDFIV